MFFIKVILGMTIAIIISTMLFFENMLISHIKYELCNFHYPIQSISSFNECKWNISIIEMVAIAYLLVIIGAVYLTALLFMLSTILKKSINVILILISVLFIPKYIFSEFIMYKYPFPIGFLNIVGYIYGIYNQETGEMEMLNKEGLIRTAGLAIILTIFSLLIAKAFYLKKKLNKKVSFLLVLIIPILLSGCKKTQTDENVVYNTSVFKLFTVSQDCVVNACKTPYIITINNRDEMLIKDPFLCDDEYENISVNGIFNNKVYYTKDKKNKDYEIFAVSLDDFSSERVFYQFESSIDGVNYLDIKSEAPNDRYQSEQLINNSCVGYWFDNDKMFMAKECGIYEYDKICNKFNPFSKGEKIIYNAYDVYVSYTKDKIFYINTEYKLEIFSVNEKSSEVLEDYMVSKCFAVNERVFFSTLDGNILCYNCNNGYVNEIYKSKNLLMNADEEYIYCINEANSFDKICINTGKIEKSYSYDNEIMEIQSSCDGSQIYVALINNDVIEYDIIKND